MLVWDFLGCMKFTDWLLTNQFSRNPVCTYWLYNNKHLLDETESSIQLLRPDKVILSETKLSPILFCMGAINWIKDEVKPNKCFIIPKKIGSNKLVVWKRLVSIKVTLNLNRLSKTTVSFIMFATK